MAATMRRLVSAMLLIVLAGLTGGVSLASPAAAAGRPVTAGSATPGVPTATVGRLGEHFVRFCVKNFEPLSTVKVENELTGAVVYIHTNRKGAGCAEVPIRRACRAVSQTIVATGTGANGKPARVTATVRAPPTRRLCSAGAGHGGHNGHHSSGSLAFTGAVGILLMVLIGLALIAAGSAAVVASRRRRAANVA